ncbi:MAG: FAD-dependent oxidoreductase [Thermoflexibacter sp.]|jgi:monoamine oxidase|nr:FAD-dependent oxidoreductase [Thermoflexibacter sp.]
MIWNRRDFLKTMIASSSLAIGGFQLGQKIDVVIIGAGLSGLYSAMLLEAQGYKVLIVEGNDRIGGRVFTLDHLEGRPEAGGTEIGDNYQRIIKIANQLGVELEEPAPMSANARDTLLHINGKNILMKDWASDAANGLEDKLKKIFPMLLEADFLQKNMPFQSFEDWAKPEFAHLDISYLQFLKSKGLSDEAIRLIDANANINGVEVTSTLHALRSAAMRTMSGSKKTMRVKGGSSRLVEAMSKTIKGDILLGRGVVSINNTKKGVSLTFANGSKVKARFAICTLPFSVLRNINIESETATGLPHVIQAEAIDNLPYIAVSQYYLLPTKPFWKEDGLPPAMWTDTILSRIFAGYNAQGEVNRFTCWANGKEAIRLDKLGEAEAIHLILKELKRIRPSTENSIEVVHTHSWQKNPYSQGAYHQYAPNQITKYIPYLNKPAGNIHFAGEHTNFRFTGMEGAVESAERVVDEIKARTK